MIASGSQASVARYSGCPVVAHVPVDAVVDELGRRGMTNVFVEGGGRVLGSFLDAGQVDAVEVFIAPSIEGGDHPGHRPGAAEPPDDRGRVGSPRASKMSTVSCWRADVHVAGSLPAIVLRRAA